MHVEMAVVTRRKAVGEKIIFTSTAVNLWECSTSWSMGCSVISFSWGVSREMSIFGAAHKLYRFRDMIETCLNGTFKDGYVISGLVFMIQSTVY